MPERFCSLLEAYTLIRTTKPSLQSGSDPISPPSYSRDRCSGAATRVFLLGLAPSNLEVVNHSCFGWVEGSQTSKLILRKFHCEPPRQVSCRSTYVCVTVFFLAFVPP